MYPPSLISGVTRFDSFFYCLICKCAFKNAGNNTIACLFGLWYYKSNTMAGI